MNSESRIACLALLGLVLTAGGCKHKPPYSDIDTSRTKAENKNSEAQASPAPPESSPEVSPAPVPQGQPPRPKPPSFLDTTNGTIKDLPSYPAARRTNQIIGPAEGANATTIILETTDPMDRIAAFYDREIKKNKWVVVDKLIDPDVSNWILKKGTDDNAKVAVTRDSNTGRMSIVLVRSEKLEEPAK
jgi:hypothetical protein